MHKPVVLRTVLCCTCAVLSGPQSRAFVASPLPPRYATLRLLVARRDYHGENILAKRASLSLTMRGSRADLRIKKDVVVIGGGLAGLSTALEIAKRGRQVTVLSRSRAEAAAEAAGGMIAPQSERLESGVYLDLCLASRAMYAEWVSGIEAIAGQGEEARTHLLSCGGILSPAFDGDAVHVWNPPAEAGYAQWIDKDQALEMEPSLSPEIIGAWWFPQDMSIDAQRMFRVLEQACTNAGVEILEGTSASGLVHGNDGSSVDAVLLEDGRRFHAESYVSATGAWMRELMPVPMLPHKGQMMALREPAETRRPGIPIGLTRVFFAEGCYIIPKRDGRIVVGSTVEVGEYGLHNTPAGMKQIIDAAVKVCPSLGDLAIDRTWAGLRPVTPDTLPVLGPSPLWRNLYVAGGYWRNGVLLAPKTAQMVADAVCGCLLPEDEVFLRAFTMERFTGSLDFSEQRTLAEARPEVAPAAVQVPQPPSSGEYSSGMSQSELLEMERAAFEGSNDGSMLSGLEGLVETRADSMAERDLEVKLPHVDLDSAAPLAPREPVNEYDASEKFSERSLKEARLSNRMLQEGNDARLEALFGDDPQEEEEQASIRNMKVKAWEDGAEELAKILGAKIVEVDIDVPEGMTEEEYMAQQGSILKVFWESPSGEDIEIPRGMNLGTMVEAGMIPPLGDNHYDDGEADAGTSITGQRKNAPGVFDPTAVKGAQERSTEVNELYAKVIANKAKVSDTRDGTPTSDQNESSALSPNGFVSTQVEGGPQPGEARVTGVQNESKTCGVKEIEMVGYDFILQDRDEREGDTARSARASTRDAPEGEAAWSMYEDIANQAVASFGEVDPVNFLPPW